MLELAQALRLQLSQDQPERQSLALVGAGGKTTALFKLAHELVQAPEPRELHLQTNPPTPGRVVLVSCTTHLAKRTARAGRYALDRPNAARGFFVSKPAPAGANLFTGLPVEEDRVAGLDGPVLEAVHNLSEDQGLYLLIEADGARRKPLKAPVAYEPAIPTWADQVIYVVGLTGLAKPLTSEWVHRPEIFANLAHLQLGEPVTAAGLARVLTDPEGGVKNIPVQSRRVVLLNQCDTPQLQAVSQQLAGNLLDSFQAVLVSRLDHTLDDQVGVLAVHEKIAGILLAAGGSNRLGQPKQLLKWKGQPFVRQVASTALQAGLSPVVVVLGAYADQVREALEGLPVQFVNNLQWQSGQSSSIHCGLKATPAQCGGAIFLLADLPQIPVALVHRLVELHAQTLAALVAPQIQGRRANPVLFDRRTFPGLYNLTGDTGGRALFPQYPVEWLQWQDASLLLDVDTLEDYHRLLEIE